MITFGNGVRQNKVQTCEDNRNELQVRKKILLQKAEEDPGSAAACKKELNLLDAECDAMEKQGSLSDAVTGIRQQMDDFRQQIDQAQQAGEAAKEQMREYTRILKTISRMMAGDEVPPSDEQKVMKFDSNVYQMAKQIQLMEQQKKEKIRKDKSAWDEDEKKQDENTDPEQTENEDQASGDAIGAKLDLNV